MFLENDTLDDLMRSVFQILLQSPAKISASKGKISHEVIGNLLILNNPRVRLSLTETRGKAFSALGELIWYLSKKRDLDYIQYYIPGYEKNKEMDAKGNEIIYGGYGPRFFNMRGQDQIQNVISLLRERKYSRRAVIQLFDAEDISKKHEDIPCTCFLQFIIRDKKLHLYASMRSNDAYIGLPHDIFAFTMLQEIIARSLAIEPGKYYHAVSSLHLYKSNLQKVKNYLNEGWQSTKHEMPEMPAGDPWESITQILALEKKIRDNPLINVNDFILDDYWKDIVRLIIIHALLKKNDISTVERLTDEMSNDVYDLYIKEKLRNRNATKRNN